MNFDYSGISPDMPEDVYSREVVSSSILQHTEERAQTMDYHAIEAMNLLPPELLTFVTPDDKNEVTLPAPPSKRPKLEPLSDAANRFGSLVTGTDTFATFSKRFLPDNTKLNTQWSLCTFQSWSSWWNEVHSDDPVPTDILKSTNAITLNKWLSSFVIEVRIKAGWKPISIKNNRYALKQHIKEVNRTAPNFLNEQDERFSGLCRTRDTVARQLCEEGIGAAVKHTEVLSYEEVLLWDRCCFSQVSF